MKISLGTDHAGYPKKELVKKHLIAKGIEVVDFGCDSDERCDYPDYIYPAAKAVTTGEADLGIVFGGSGNGEAIVANKVKGVRCGLCWNVESAQLTKEHNNANVISIGARLVTDEIALQIVDIWLNSTFEGGRHVQRIEKIYKLEEAEV